MAVAVHADAHRDVAERLGLRRVEVVVLVLSDDGVRAQVTGVAHRLPLTRRVSLGTASALIRGGARWRTIDQRTPSSS